MKTGTRRRTDTTRLLSELLNEIAYTYFPLRAAGDAMTARFGQTTAEWGMLRTLDAQGPMTVASLARSRPVARQWIQRLANELNREGLIKLVENPNHKRAKLMLIMPAGKRLLQRINAAFDGWAREMKGDLDERGLRVTLDTLRELREQLLRDYRRMKS